MNELKTISEIAKELSVSRQAVYKKIKNNAELANALQEFTVNNGKVTVYSLQGQELIKQAFTNIQTVKSKPSTIDSKLSTDNRLIDTLMKQLETKDKQIEALTEQNAALINQLNNLTAALQAAQALHRIDKQQKAIEVFEAPQDPPQQQPPKRGFFQRLFGRH